MPSKRHASVTIPFKKEPSAKEVKQEEVTSVEDTAPVEDTTATEDTSAEEVLPSLPDGLDLGDNNPFRTHWGIKAANVPWSLYTVMLLFAGCIVLMLITMYSSRNFSKTLQERPLEFPKQIALGEITTVAIDNWDSNLCYVFSEGRKTPNCVITKDTLNILPFEEGKYTVLLAVTEQDNVYVYKGCFEATMNPDNTPDDNTDLNDGSTDTVDDTAYPEVAENLTKKLKETLSKEAIDAYGAAIEANLGEAIQRMKSGWSYSASLSLLLALNRASLSLDEEDTNGYKSAWYKALGEESGAVAQVLYDFGVTDPVKESDGLKLLVTVRKGIQGLISGK